MSLRVAILTVVTVAAVFVVMSRDSGRSGDQSPAARTERARAEQEPAAAEGGADLAAANVSPGEPSGLPRLVDLGSDQCIPCKMMAPILADLERDFEGRLRVEVIDVRKNRLAGREYGIRVIPTQVFYDASGQERFRHEGFMSREAILAAWDELGVDLNPASAAPSR